MDSGEIKTNAKLIIPKTLLIKALYGLCPNCGLKIDVERVGDGGAWFAMLITSILVGLGALLLELNFHPKLWLHIVIWLPVILLLSVVILRPFKALLLCLSFKNKG